MWCITSDLLMPPALCQLGVVCLLLIKFVYVDWLSGSLQIAVFSLPAFPLLGTDVDISLPSCQFSQNFKEYNCLWDFSFSEMSLISAKNPKIVWREEHSEIIQALFPPESSLTNRANTALIFWRSHSKSYLMKKGFLRLLMSNKEIVIDWLLIFKLCTL